MIFKNIKKTAKFPSFYFILILIFLFSFPLIILADDFSLSPPGFAEGETPDFLELLGWILKAAFFTISILAVLMIIVGGVQYIIAGSTGNPEKTGDAKTRIMMSIYGILLALSSWLILKTINPDLLKLELNIPGLGNGNPPPVEGGNQNWVCVIRNPCSVTRIANEEACSVCEGNCRLFTPEQETEARQRCNI